jgi:hypothetical protein
VCEQRRDQPEAAADLVVADARRQDLGEVLGVEVGQGRTEVAAQRVAEVQ